MHEVRVVQKVHQGQLWRARSTAAHLAAHHTYSTHTALSTAARTDEEEDVAATPRLRTDLSQSREDDGDRRVRQREG